jgi:hypothetical protein
MAHDRKPVIRLTTLYPEADKAARHLGMKVSRTFLLAQALKDSKARAQKLQVPQEEKNQELWRILGKLYTQFLFLQAHKSERSKFIQQCRRIGLKTNSKKLDLALLIVYFHFENIKPGGKSRYASVLRQAALENIAARKLARQLAVPGFSIKAMAKKFADYRRQQKGAKPSLNIRVDIARDITDKLRNAGLGDRYRATLECDGADHFSIVRAERRRSGVTTRSPARGHRTRRQHRSRARSRRVTA